jgi:hypothetical protein
MTVSVRAPRLALPHEIELCFYKVAIALARVENCEVTRLGDLCWEWAIESMYDHFVLRRAFLPRSYPQAVERELRAALSDTRRETLH